MIHVLCPNRESRSHEEADACSVLIDLVIHVLGPNRESRSHEEADA